MINRVKLQQAGYTLC